MTAQCPNESRVAALEKEVQVLRNSQKETRFINILADCVSTVYDKILHIIINNHQEVRVLSCMLFFTLFCFL